MKKYLLIIMVFVLCVIGADAQQIIITKKKTSVTLDDSYAVSNADDNNWLCTTYSRAGNSFTSGGGILDHIELYLSKVGSPTGNLIVQIYAHTGTYGTSSLPTGSALAASDTFDVTGLTTSPVLTSIAFSGASRISLTAATYYTYSMEYAGGDCTNVRVMAQQDTSSPTHSGNSFSYDTGWNAEAIADGIFYLYVMR
jgi:hypothetical protein